MRTPSPFVLCSPPSFQLIRPFQLTSPPKITLTCPSQRYPQVIEPSPDKSPESPQTIFAHVKIDDNYVRSICRKFLGRGVDFDELYSLAQDGILHAAKKYDPNHPKRATFQTYATTWIRERILQRFRDIKKKETPVREYLKQNTPLYSSPVEYEPSDIDMEKLFISFLGHIQECTENIMESPRATIQMYGELLSAEVKYPYDPVVMHRREEMERLLEPIIKAFLQSEEATKIYMSRFGAKIVDFTEIGAYRDVSSQRACAEFAAICSKVVWACNDPIMQQNAYAYFKLAIKRESQDELPAHKISLC